MCVFFKVMRRLYDEILEKYICHPKLNVPSLLTLKSFKKKNFWKIKSFLFIVIFHVLKVNEHGAVKM